ncbi:MAG: alpha/beta hydrolase [Verrucomicrobiales bacterium]|nr:alpha/beta hydrolase [Verrucomicrobiales bacterium]
MNPQPLSLPRLTGLVRLAAAALALLATSALSAADNVFLWPALAPGETSEAPGEAQPPRAGEEPPVTRVVNIRRPSLDVFLPEKPNGTGMLIIPGGGFGKVVTDKEGSEAAAWLNRLGIAAFVLRHRTSEGKPADEPLWHRPLQDAQRAMRLLHARAAEWKLQPDRIGVLGFSAGGQVAAVLMTSGPEARYAAVDEVDGQPFMPAFGLLIYPWKTLAASGDALLPEIAPGPGTPPAFIVHTHDDASSSLGSVLIYAALKRHGVEAELHIYRNGGHGYGMRPVEGSDIGTWPDRAADWLRARGLATAP